jgi:hypothetical protein
VGAGRGTLRETSSSATMVAITVPTMTTRADQVAPGATLKAAELSGGMKVS